MGAVGGKYSSSRPTDTECVCPCVCVSQGFSREINRLVPFSCFHKVLLN